MNTIHIDADKCKQDDICVQACPFGIFASTQEGVPAVIQGAGDYCINCGHCVALCPGEAITVNGYGAKDCDPVNRELTASREQVMQLFRSRRSIRCYKDKAVERKTLAALLDMTRWAPTAKNVQPVHWMVFEKAQDVRRLSGMVIDWMRENKMFPELVQAFDQGRDMINREAPCLLVTHAPKDGIKPVEDCCIAMTTVEAAAPAFGLGACWAGFFMAAAKNHAPLGHFLDLPQGHEPYAALMLGYPQFTYRRIPPRNELKVQWR